MSSSSLPHSPRLSQVGNYGALFAQALPRDAHSTPFYCTRPQSLALGYGERSLSASMGTSGISSLGVYTLNGPTPTPQSLLAGSVHHSFFSTADIQAILNRYPPCQTFKSRRGVKMSHSHLDTLLGHLSAVFEQLQALSNLCVLINLTPGARTRQHQQQVYVMSLKMAVCVLQSPASVRHWRRSAPGLSARLDSSNKLLPILWSGRPRHSATAWATGYLQQSAPSTPRW